MKLIVYIAVTALLAALATWFLPWWMMAVVAFGMAIVAGFCPGRSFLLGFCSISVMWLSVALWRDNANGHILSGRMAQLFHVPGTPAFLAVTVLIGGLVGGLASWAGGLVAKRG